eukprot:302220_1
MPVSLFKDMARNMGSGTTMNDIILLCVSIAFGRYMDELGNQGYDDIDNIKLLLPIGNALRPSLYCDYYGGLCNRMTPVIVPLNLPRNNRIAAFSPTHAVDEIRSYMERVKVSNTPLLMTCLNTILQPLLSLDNLKEAAKHSFEGVSCVYSNVPGPVESISLTPSAQETKAPPDRSYKVNKMQVVMP